MKITRKEKKNKQKTYLQMNYYEILLNKWIYADDIKDVAEFYIF